MELDNTGFFIKMREQPYFLNCSGTICIDNTGTDYYFNPAIEIPKQSNCSRCGAPMMSYQTDCEYCGKSLKKKLCKNM